MSVGFRKVFYRGIRKNDLKLNLLSIVSLKRMRLGYLD